MTSKALSTGLRGVSSVQRILCSGLSPAATYRVCVAHISGKTSRGEPLQMKKPWPYKKWGYNNFMALLDGGIDGTLQRLNENSKVIVVEGPPAVGKSAVARALAEELEMKYFPMVTSDSYYINRYGYDMRQLDSKLPPNLQSFDENAFLKKPKSDKTIFLQTTLWIQKFQQYIDALSHLLNTGQGVVLDRCVYSANIFTDLFTEAGYISQHDRGVLYQIQDTVMKELMKPHLIVYLDAPPSVVEANLKKRGRGEEKIWTKDLLEKLDNKYKHGYLKTITKHAEMVAYDWSTPGEAEVIVEDIERIDFDRFDIHDPKMEDWRHRDSEDWNELRWHYTHAYPQIMAKINNNGISWKVPALMLEPEEQLLLERVYEENKVPGTKYQDGYNVDQGDNKILWTTQPFMTTEWVDYDLKKTSTV